MNNAKKNGMDESIEGEYGKRPFFSWLLARFVVEMFWSLVLYYIFHLNWFVSPPMAHIVHGVAIGAITYLLGKKTGALLNPAVVVAYMIPSFIAPRCIYKCRMGKRASVVFIVGTSYIVAHILGTFGGHWLYFATIATIPVPPVWNFFWGAFILTIFSSMIICVVVIELTRKVYRPSKNLSLENGIITLNFEKGYYGLAIGGMYFVMGWMTNFFSGGILNPLYGIWPSVFHAFNTGIYSWLLVTLFYWGVPMIGAILAGLTYLAYVWWFCSPDHWKGQKSESYDTMYHCRDEYVNNKIGKRIYRVAGKNNV